MEFSQREPHLDYRALPLHHWLGGQPDGHGGGLWQKKWLLDVVAETHRGVCAADEFEKENEKIAVEIKTFGNFSFITALYEAVGKYIIYRNVLKIMQPERVLYLATPEGVYGEFFEEPVLKKVMEEENFKLVVYNPVTQTISQWIK